MSKRSNRGNQGSDDQVAMAQRCYERRDFRQAVKYARVAFRSAACDQTKQLLEKVSLARADELLHGGHVDQARELLSPLVDAISHPELTCKLPDLLLRARMIDQFPRFRTLVSESDRQAFEFRAFDRAVIDLNHAQREDVRKLATLVRNALAAIEAGHDDAAAECLRGIPRRSPAADWRYFIRGLSAWYRSDADAVDANWSCLQPDRAAAQIVGRLTAGFKPSGAILADCAESGDLQRVAGGRFGVRSDAVLPPSVIRAIPGLRLLEELQGILLDLANENWSAVIQAFRQSHSMLRQYSPALAERIAAKIVGRIVFDGDAAALNEFCRCVEAPADNPNWNRVRAALAERLFHDGDEYLATVENLWRQCLRDIDRSEMFSDVERQIASALINDRIGQLMMSEIRGLVACPCGESHDEEIAGLREQAVEFLEHAISAYPACMDPWQRLMQLYELVNEPRMLANTRRRVLQHFPDDVETLESAGNFELQDGDPLQGRDYLLQALRLRPLVNGLRVAVVSAHQECTRRFIRAGEIDAARRELDAATSFEESLSPSDDQQFHRMTNAVLLALVEQAAGNDPEAEHRIQAARKTLTDPVAVDLWLAIEATRVDLPRHMVQRFELAWRGQLGKKFKPQAAGWMARLISGQLKGASLSRALYGADVLKYVKRLGRAKVTSGDLRHMCVFLEAMQDQPLYLKHVEKGRKLFPGEPWFHFAAAEAEVKKGVSSCRRKFANDAFTKVLELCGHSSDPAEQKMAQSARHWLSLFKEVGLAKPSFFSNPFGSKKTESFEEIYAAVGELMYELGISPENLAEKLKSEMKATR